MNFSPAPNDQTNDPPKDLPALTSLRGIAALVVVLFHSSFLTSNYAGGGPPGLWRRGYLAVDLFFFLSGFVLTHVYGHRLAEERSWRTVSKFLWARFCRIYPACLFTTAIFIVQYASGRLSFPPGVSFKDQVTAALLLMQVPWLDQVVINGPSWSISAEWYAYLFFPLAVPMICGLRARTAAILCMVLLVVVAVDHTIFGYEQQTAGWGALARVLPEFTVGVLAYRSYREGQLRRIWEKDITLIGLAAVILTASLTDVSDGPIVIVLLALLLASVCNSGRIAGILNARPLRWLGEISYSVYIFQILPLMVAATFSRALVEHGLGGPLFLAIAASFAIGSGILVHRCVDLPVRAALRRLPDRVRAFSGRYRPWRNRTPN